MIDHLKLLNERSKWVKDLYTEKYKTFMKEIEEYKIS